MMAPICGQGGTGRQRRASERHGGESSALIGRVGDEWGAYLGRLEPLRVRETASTAELLARLHLAHK